MHSEWMRYFLYVFNSTGVFSLLVKELFTAISSKFTKIKAAPAAGAA
jgi:hypothetical protein